MKHKALHFIILVISSISCLAQEEYSNILLSYSETQDIYYYKYNPDFIIKADYKSQSVAVNEYPEQLVQSVLSATSQEWENYNTLGGKEKAEQIEESHFEKIKKMDKDKNYFELIHKLTFKIDNISTVIVKFFLHQENTQPISGAMVMQKVNGKWYKTSNINLSTLAIMVMRLKSDVLVGAILGSSTDSSIQKLHNKINSETGISLTIFENEFLSWYEPNNNNKELFIDSKTW
jgi:hypothetical protein